MASHTKRSADEEEELSYEKQRLHLAEMERKANFEQTQAEVRRQKDSLQMLRRENKELKAALSQAKVASKSKVGSTTTVSTAGFQDRQQGLMQSRMHQLRRQIDDIRTSNDEKATEVGKMNEKIDELNREGQPILDEASPMTQKIRMLENRLDKSLIKHNEAMAVRRTYEQIVKRLREERVGFDNQLAAIEKTLKSKEHDYVELETTAHNVKHAKELAKAKVQQFKSTYAEERRQKKKELEDRKAFVDLKMSQVMEQEKKKQKQQEEQQATVKQEEEDRRKKETSHSAAQLRTEEEEERLRQNSEAYRRIKEVTRASNVDEVCAKFNAQEATHKQLTTAMSEAHDRIDKLHEQKVELQRKLDEARYSGSGQLGSRRIVDEFETHLAEARAQLDKAKKDYEEVSLTFTGVVAGVEHLAEKLGTYRPEVVAPAVTDETIIDALKVCEQKLSSLGEAVAGTEESMDDILATTEVEMPKYNMRISVKQEDDEDDERGGRDGKDGEENEDDPHDRLSLKEMSMSAVEREAKKNRKMRKKKDDDA